VARLVLGDLREAAANPVREAGLLERVGVELGERLVVEGVFEMLERERVLEDSRVWK
jgi:hypothetical protein